MRLQDVEPLVHRINGSLRAVRKQRGKRKPEADEFDLHLRRRPLRVVLADHPEVFDITPDRVESDRRESCRGQQDDHGKIPRKRSEIGHSPSIRTTCQISRRR